MAVNCNTTVFFVILAISCKCISHITFLTIDHSAAHQCHVHRTKRTKLPNRDDAIDDARKLVRRYVPPNKLSWECIKTPLTSSWRDVASTACHDVLNRLVLNKINSNYNHFFFPGKTKIGHTLVYKTYRTCTEPGKVIPKNVANRKPA